tara:strand:- start:463 stop:768 length:306 start_codon:yes stop_codon:yes gene_type:complete
MKKNYKNRNYLEFVSRMRCIILHKSCNGATNAHHLLKPYDGNRGMGLKASDKNVVPLCFYHHQELHDKVGNENKFWTLYGYDEDYGRRIAEKLFNHYKKTP